MTDESKPTRVLLIFAHPDDAEFGVGGTVAHWTAAGAEVTLVVVTDGSKGSPEPGMTSAQLIATREAEQRAAAAVLGIREVVYLRFPDGNVFNTPELREALTRQIRRYRPDVLVTHDPTTRFTEDRINHPDHRAVGDTALDAVFPLARDRLNYLDHEHEGLAPHKVLDIWLTGAREPNHVVDITATFDQKIAALREHRSQIANMDELAHRLRERYTFLAADYPFELAENFRRITLTG